MAASPLPPGLGPSFLVSTARVAGVTESRLRGPDLERPFFGIRTHRSQEESPGTTSERKHLDLIEQFRVGMADHEFLVLVSAAVAWGLPLPSYLLDDHDIDVGVLAPHRSPRLAGVRGHQVVPKLVRIVRHPSLGIRLTSPASTWAMVGRLCRDIKDLVAVGDASVRTWRMTTPLATPAQLVAAAGAGRRVGVLRLREALPLIRTASASRGESWARVLLVDAGFAEPVLNHPVRDGDGALIGHADLAYPDRRVAMEYEGAHHLKDAQQWAYDIRRYERMTAAGWTVVRLTSADVFRDPSRLIARVRAAVSRRG